VRVRVLGSAAGGGFPQWNCHCGTCEAARAGVRARARTQSSLAIRGADGHTLDPGRPQPLDGSSLAVEAFPVGGDAPRYLGSDVELESSGFVFRDSRTGGVLAYVPGLASLDDRVSARLAASDLVLVDGTFWHDDDLARLGISDRTARDMGHTPLAGPGGSLAVLGGLQRPRKVLVHINNTNPILLEDSDEREEVVRAGVEVAYDGLEVEL
jgi:pyrroloquinoline quinone biosynthesis protein B